MGQKGMQFKFEAYCFNTATKKGFPIAAGTTPTVTIKRGESNQIAIGVSVVHTDIGGPDPPKSLTNPPLSVERGWPFQTRYDFVWDVEVEGDEISILGDPKRRKEVKKERKGVTTEFKPEGSAKYLAIHAQSTFQSKGLKLDLPFVEGEGDLTDDLGLGDKSIQSEEVKFLCKLEAEKAEKKTWPKIPSSILSAKAYFEVKDKSTLPTSSVRDIEGWVKDIKNIQELYDVIKDSDVTIHLDGYTSKSGSKDYNKKLAKERIDAVVRLLKKDSNLGSGIDTVADPKAQSKTEEEHDYRVEVYFDKSRAETAMKAREP
jgi:outer membrane protein OmpA-like peptidoglycan-associated protein